MKDASLITTKALPAAAASALTDPLTLGVTTAALLGRPVIARLSLPALPALVDAKTVTVELFDCATTDGSYVVVAGTGTMVVTGADSAGSAAKVWEVALPPHTREFVKGKATVLTGGGDNTARSLTFEIVDDLA